MNETEGTAQATAARAGPKPHRVVAVVVTFNPDLVTLDALLDATRVQVTHVVVIDNGSRAESAARLRQACEGRAQLYALPENVGIAGAQNRGIEVARTLGATDVLLLDHDSVPEAGMVERLCIAADEMREAGVAVAAVGPVIVDRQSGSMAPLPQIVDGMVRFIPAPSDAPTRCEYLIASGTLIALAAFDTVGPFDESYFVDQVDIEWCLRAGRTGLASICAPRARLMHSIGDEVVSFWFLGRRQLAVHSATRDYFYFRNSIRLIRSPDVPRPWRRFWARRLFRLFALQALFVPPRIARVKAMLRGTIEALHGS
jgi:rhamnosyltransferase